MGTTHFFDYLSLVEEYAFRISEATIFVVFVGVYSWHAIRHILRIGRNDK